MNAWHDEPDTPECHVQIDAYGIKATVRPSDLGAPPPATWAEVRKQIADHLRRLAVAPTRLLAEAFEAATRLVRGLSSIPDAVAQRIHRGHAAADRTESQRQALTAGARMSKRAMDSEERSERARQLVERLDEIFQHVRETQGREAAVVFLDDGRVLLHLGTPSDAKGAVEAAAKQIAATETQVDHQGASAPGAIPQVLPLTPETPD
jgi:hypothetical protein